MLVENHGAAFATKPKPNKAGLGLLWRLKPQEEEEKINPPHFLFSFSIS